MTQEHEKQENRCTIKEIKLKQMEIYSSRSPHYQTP